MTKTKIAAIVATLLALLGLAQQFLNTPDAAPARTGVTVGAADAGVAQ